MSLLRSRFHVQKLWCSHYATFSLSSNFVQGVPEIVGFFRVFFPLVVIFEDICTLRDCVSDFRSDITASHERILASVFSSTCYFPASTRDSHLVSRSLSVTGTSMISLLFAFSSHMATLRLNSDLGEASKMVIKVVMNLSYYLLIHN